VQYNPKEILRAGKGRYSL